jgi:hypothetical protein
MVKEHDLPENANALKKLPPRDSEDLIATDGIEESGLDVVLLVESTVSIVTLGV